MEQKKREKVRNRFGRSLAIFGLLGVTFFPVGNAGETELERLAFEEGEFEFRVAALSNWSLVLLRFDPHEQGQFSWSVDTNGSRFDLDLTYMTASGDFTGGSPVFLMGKRVIIDLDNILVPEVDDLADLAGWKTGKTQSDSAAGLFYLIVPIHVWEAVQGEISDKDLKSREGDLRYNELFFAIRATPSNKVHFITAQKNLAGEEVVLALGWLPGLARGGVEPIFDADISLRNLGFSRLTSLPSSEERLLGKYPSPEDHGEAREIMHSDALQSLLDAFGEKFASPPPESDLLLSDETLELLMDDQWTLSLGSRHKVVSQPSSPYQWDFPNLGQPEWVWHLHWKRLFAQLTNAYQRTGNPAYVHKWWQITEDWLDQNPPGTPLAWRGIVTAARVTSHMRQISQVYNSASLSDSARVRLLNSLADHAEYLADPFMYHPVNNWGTAETSSLLNLATNLSLLKGASNWIEIAHRRVLNAKANLVNNDGSTNEMSIGYHMHTANQLISSLENLGIRPNESERIRNMFNFILCLTKPDGSLPVLGEGFGPDTSADFLRKGYRLFGDKRWLYVATQGSEGEPPQELNTYLADSPHFVMRTSWTDPKGMYLLLKGTTRGRPGFDGFNLEFYFGGTTLLPDAGVYSYDEPWRSIFAATSQHSTVTVGGDNQIHGNDVDLKHFVERPNFSFFDGYLRSYDNVLHRRRIVFVRESPSYFIVLDDLSGDKSGRVESRYWLPPEPADVSLLKNRPGALVRTENGVDLLIIEMNEDELTASMRDGWYASAHALKTERQGLVLGREALPASFRTLVYPSKSSVGAPPTVEAYWDPTASVIEVKHFGWRDLIVFYGDGEIPEFQRLKVR